MKNNIKLNLPNTPIFNTALKIVKTLQKKNYQAYFVGGVVRDLLLGKPSHDVDIVTSATPDEIIKIFPRTHHIGISFGIINVVENDIDFEVATFREEREYSDGRRPDEVIYTDDPELDAIRRDFTINGMFYDPINHIILDFVRGQCDLRKGVLKTIGNAEERFKEDYLRMLRAVRFAVRFSLELSDETKQAIAMFAEKSTILSMERIRDEFNKMITGINPHKAILLLQETGLLQYIFPELNNLDGVEQDAKYHPEGDVLVHTLLMLKSMSKPNAEIAWSVLLHDISKPETRFVGDDGIAHFYGHESVGAIKAEEILRRFRFSNKFTKRVSFAVKNHMKYAAVDKMRKSTWKKLIALDTFHLELELHRLDCMACHQNLSNYVLLLDRLEELENEPVLPKALISGRDLIELGYKPGPLFKEIINDIFNLQIEEKIKSKEEALEYLKNKFEL